MSRPRRPQRPHHARRPRRRRRSPGLVVLVSAGFIGLAACSDDTSRNDTSRNNTSRNNTERNATGLRTEFSTMPTVSSPTSTPPAERPDGGVRVERVPVAGTTLAVQVRGEGPPLLLVHGGGEDATMLSAQADSLAAAGYQVVTYDRRGTGGSGREDWPGNGADQHADDAAALLDALGLAPAAPIGLKAGAAAQLAEWTGRPTVQAVGHHEVYLADPAVLTGIVTSTEASS
jgi:hypothetical protein